MIKVLLLDIDGVLIDDTKVFYDSIHKFYNLTKEDFMEFYHSDFWASLTNKEDLEEVLPKWLKKWHIDDNVENFLDNWFKTEDRPNVELIEYIKKFNNVFLASSQEKHRMKYVLHKMNLKIYVVKHLGLICLVI